MKLNFSIVIPVFNRPNEIEELLKSIKDQQYKNDFEVIVVEDGSTIKSDKIVDKFNDDLDIKYYFKENSGPGLSRNFGMALAKGNYFIVLDSDCLLSSRYLIEVEKELTSQYTDAFGGPDAALESFTHIQKAINYSMTSFLTTGGLRGNKNQKDKFQLRSFNLGLSKESFIQTKGFSAQYFGEDIDLTFRLWENDFTTQFIPSAFVYHKRRTSFKQFFDQTFNFGSARPILSKIHPGTGKITFWFPLLFCLFFMMSLLFCLFGKFLFINILLGYLLLIFIDSSIKNKNLLTGIYSILSTIIQFVGYGLGFLKSFFRLNVLNKTKEEAFPKMFNRN